mmetsp:Transcript_3933/g.7831  ORF Transcript_3933/g.7831 Transcript_3933/m.7831 type:complete len:399 (-) Transcript_3933:43-1239(-)
MSRDDDKDTNETEDAETKYQFTASEITEIRQRAAARFEQLLRPLDDHNDIGSAACFRRYGFLCQRQFCTPTECHAMKAEMQRLVNEEWDPHASLDSFGTDDTANVARGDYFLESANRIHFFTEPTALETTTEGKQVLKPEYQGARRMESLNKVGHALHISPSTPFGQYFRSPKLAQLVQDELGWKDPVVPQSMYIFKQARTGGAVHSHQDATFLYTTPRQTCLGLWLALDDATISNGCLWVRPASHLEPVRRQYCRNPAHFGATAIENRSNHASAAGGTNAPKFVMETLVDEEKSSETTTTTTTSNKGVPWEGKLPQHGWQGLFDAGFVPVECQAGDLLVFEGTLDHLSLPNYSDKARHTFQLHLVEGPAAGITWAPSNWLQYPPGKPFVKMEKVVPK